VRLVFIDEVKWITLVVFFLESYQVHAFCFLISFLTSLVKKMMLSQMCYKYRNAGFHFPFFSYLLSRYLISVGHLGLSQKWRWRFKSSWVYVMNTG